jgi:photosystem II stability/assembly factor-like uncharacterized protein
MRTRLLAIVILTPFAALTLLFSFPDRAGAWVTQKALMANLLTSAPTVTGVSPATAPNDLNTPIVISGTNFTAELSGTQVLTVPLVYLGNARLEDVGWVDTATLTATVPWGLSLGVYTLTVTNPDGQSGSLPQAFTVTQGIGVWSSGGPYGGDIWHIVVNPLSPTQVLATAMWSGLFASEDKAAHWRTAYLGAFPLRPAIDAQNWRVIYMSSDGMIARSDDGGETWQTFWRQRMCVDDVYPFAHPTITGKVYFAVACRLDAGGGSEGSGLYESDDWGITWIPMTEGLTDTNVTALAFYPGNPDLMLAGTRDGNVFVSQNGGRNWSFAAHVADHIERLVFNPFGAHEAWAVNAGRYPHDMNRPSVFKSTNADFTAWESVTIDPQYDIWSLTFHPSISGTIYAAAGAGYVSADGGETWQPLGPGLPISTWEVGVKEFSVDPQQPNRLYAATQRGVYLSEDGGATWFKSDYGLGGVLPTSLAVSPFDPQTVYAATLGADIVKTVDGGQTWQKINIPWMEWTSNLATDPFIEGRLYEGGSCMGDILISPDGGSTYHTVRLTLPITYTGLSAICANAIVPDPHRAGHILAGVAIPYGPVHSTWHGGLYVSEDYGEHWQWVEIGDVIGPVSALVFDPNNSQNVYAGTDKGELLRSEDGGAIWHIVSSYTGTQTITAIAIHPQDSQVIFISGQGDPNAIWASSDGGNTWARLANQPTTGPVWALKFALTTPPTLYAGTMSDGLWRTTDNGRTWTVANGLARGNVRSLATATDGERAIVYVGVSSGALSGSASSGFNVAPADSETTLLGSGVFRLSIRLLGQHVYLPFIAR